MKRLLLLVIALLTALSLSSCRELFITVDMNIKNYETRRSEIAYADEVMPPLDEVGDYTGASYSYMKNSLIFDVESIALFLDYGAAEYTAEKEAALAKYSFNDPKVIKNDIPAPMLDYNGYFMQAISASDYTDTCKAFGYVGYNDAACSMVYVYFYDPDLDYIAEDREDINEAMRDYIDSFILWNE